MDLGPSSFGSPSEAEAEEAAAAEEEATAAFRAYPELPKTLNEGTVWLNIAQKPWMMWSVGPKACKHESLKPWGYSGLRVLT